MPLDDNARLRFQVLDADRQEVLEQLSQGDWSPIFCGTAPRIGFDGWKLASVFEVDIPGEGQPVVDDRRIPRDELASPKKSDAEVAALRRYLGWPK